MEREDEYIVSIWITPMPWPLSFAVHAWFVCEHGNVRDRVEVWAPVWVKQGSSTIVKNALDPEMGFRKSYLQSVSNPRKRGKATKYEEIRGYEGSIAYELYQCIMQSERYYPYTKSYRMWPGPNSNTFVSWVLSRFTQLSVRLPWNAFGKGYGGMLK
jgi:Protein of unknown function (DUF3750)